MTSYREELIRSMNFLGDKNDSVFIGQAVSYEGTGMSKTFNNIHASKLIELPVEEEFQLGLAIGMSFNNLIPICIYPRWNFLLLAVNQLVNHLDKVQELNGVNSTSKVIIRTAVGSESPMYPGPQHIGDFTEAFKLMFKNISIHKLVSKNDIFETYRQAYERNDGVSSLIIELSDKYDS
jgi:pyruvate/2-oxoglutarate/acetoin dehydrogenase E1 component